MAFVAAMPRKGRSRGVNQSTASVLAGVRANNRTAILAAMAKGIHCRDPFVRWNGQHGYSSLEGNMFHSGIDLTAKGEFTMGRL